MDLFAYGKEEDEREEQKTRPIFPTKETRKTIGEKMTRKIRGLTALEVFFSQIWTLPSSRKKMWWESRPAAMKGTMH